jgi:hypothetical protein
MVVVASNPCCLPGLTYHSPRRVLHPPDRNHPLAPSLLFCGTCSVGSGQVMAFACLIAPSLLNLDDVFEQQQQGKSKSTPQMSNDIVELFDDPLATLSTHDHSGWNIVLMVAGFTSQTECMQFVKEWKLGRKLIPRLIRGLQLAIARNNQIPSSSSSDTPKLAVCCPCYSIDSIQRILSSSNRSQGPTTANKHLGDRSESTDRSSS